MHNLLTNRQSERTRKLIICEVVKGVAGKKCPLLSLENRYRHKIFQMIFFSFFECFFLFSSKKKRVGTSSKLKLDEFIIKKKKKLNY